MKIAMVITSYHPVVGGAEKQLAQLAGIFISQGHEVHVVTRRWPGLAPEETVDGVPVHRIAAPGPKPAAAAAFVFGAAAALRSLRPDVIHSHSLFTPAIAATLGKSLCGAPVIAKPMCGGEATSIREKPLGGFRIGRFARSIDRFAAVSGEIEDELKGLGVPASKIRKIPNGVDLARFRPAADAAEKAALRARLGLPDEVLFVFAGRDAAQKRLPALLEQWGRVQAALPGAQLLLAGANRKTPGAEDVDTVGAGGLTPALLGQPGVRFLGHVDDMPSLYRAADVFVLPSDREGLSNALLEACASGLPAVASKIGGVEDVIEDGRNGLLYPPQDLPDMGRAMIELGQDADMRRRIGAAARDTVMAEYDIRITAERLLTQYREMTGRDAGLQDAAA